MSRRVAARIHIPLPTDVMGAFLTGLADHYDDVIISADPDGTLIIIVEVEQ